VKLFQWFKMWCSAFKANSVKGQQTVFFEITLEKRE